MASAAIPTLNDVHVDDATFDAGRASGPRLPKRQLVLWQAAPPRRPDFTTSFFSAAFRADFLVLFFFMFACSRMRPHAGRT
jgi:hypothetical protein